MLSNLLCRTRRNHAATLVMVVAVMTVMSVWKTSSAFVVVNVPTLMPPTKSIAPRGHNCAVFPVRRLSLPKEVIRSHSSTGLSVASDDKKATTAFELTIDMPPSNSGVQALMGIDPILSVPSELVVVRYRVPFGLAVRPHKNLAVVSKAGAGGEQEWDVLRFCSQWTLGLPRGDGMITTAAAFSGGVNWQCSMFNVVKAKAWEQLVESLTSNTESRTDEVVLIFERALDGVIAPELQ